jgi:hypothetical protein
MLVGIAPGAATHRCGAELRQVASRSSKQLAEERLVGGRAQERSPPRRRETIHTLLSPATERWFGDCAAALSEASDE